MYSKQFDHLSNAHKSLFEVFTVPGLTPWNSLVTAADSSWPIADTASVLWALEKRRYSAELMKHFVAV